MGATTDDAKALVDQIKDQQQVLAAAQAKHAELMLKFSNTRRHLDQQRITDMRNEGADPRYTPGEFAALEIGLATTTNSRKISRTIGIARRLHDETPDAWDAWQAGHIDHDRAARINKALIRLTRDTSKQLLNALVVDVATHKTAELLGRWLNEFVAQVEPDQTNDRMRRSLEDRYVSIRPDIDGISFISAAIASADADAINQVLDALAAIAEPGDTRTFQQRRRRLHRTPARQDQQRLPRQLGRRPRRRRGRGKLGRGRARRERTPRPRRTSRRHRRPRRPSRRRRDRTHSSHRPVQRH